MNFRVAEFKRKGRRLEFNRFIYKGFKLDQNGRLWFKNRIANTTDKRRKVFYARDFETGRKDENGRPIYENDICELIGEVIGQIEFLKNKGAFLLVHKNGFMKVPYSFMDENEAHFLLKGNVYEKNGG